MTYQYELEFKTLYILDLLTTIHWMAYANSNASHSVKQANSPAFIALYDQVNVLVLYAIDSIDSIDSDLLALCSKVRSNSLDLYWGV